MIQDIDSRLSEGHALVEREPNPPGADNEIWTNVWKDENFDKKYNEIPHYFDLPLLLRFAKGKVLEAGCGLGQVVKFLNDRGGDCYGIDNSEEAVRIAKSKTRNIHFGDISHMPFKDGFFDTVLSFGVIEHTDPKPLLAEMKRVLKKGGFLYLTVPKKFHWYFFQRSYIKLKRDWHIGYEKLYSERELLKLLKKFGFKPIVKINKSHLSHHMFGFVCKNIANGGEEKIS